MQVEHIALVLAKRRAFVESWMVQEGKTVQLRPDHAIGHETPHILFIRRCAFPKPRTDKPRNDRHLTSAGRLIGARRCKL
jgi:hypothetical protein